MSPVIAGDVMSGQMTGQKRPVMRGEVGVNVDNRVAGREWLGGDKWMVGRDKDISGGTLAVEGGR
jgi:hypothetical protein